MKPIKDWKEDKERHRFYNSKEWRALRAYKLMLNPFCEECSTEERPVMATDVHHIVEIQENPKLRLELSNLQSLCREDHSRHTYNEHLNGAWKRRKDIQILKKKWNLDLTSKKDGDTSPDST